MTRGEMSSEIKLLKFNGTLTIEPLETQTVVLYLWKGIVELGDSTLAPGDTVVITDSSDRFVLQSSQDSELVVIIKSTISQRTKNTISRTGN
jgi:redox-sensitive bicupin YhaK (pirin superfamily)